MITDNITQLRALAREVQNYQLERGWSDKRLTEKLADIGSSKTYKRILDDADPLDQMDVEGQIVKYSAAVAYITELRSKDRAAEPIYEDFSNVIDARAAVGKAMLEESIARLVIIPGPTSTGKDVIKDVLCRMWPKKVIAVEADEFWRDSLSAPTSVLYGAVGIINRGEGKMPTYPMERSIGIKDELRKSKKILIINEAHHMGIRAINLCKTLINQTPTVIVWLCEPTLMGRLLSSSFTETTQLTGNRLFETVHLRTPPSNEILDLMERRGVKFADKETRNTAGSKLAAEAPAFGNWRFVVQVSRKLIEHSKRTPVNLKVLTDAIGDVQAMRTRIVKQQEG